MSRPVPGVLSDGDLTAVEEMFGVGEAQVRRDHLISHVLAALSTLGTESMVFLGGTALSRTWLPELRLSEDIDLMALGDRGELSDLVEKTVRRELRRGFGEVSFTPSLRAARHPESSVISVRGLRVRVQLLAGTGYPAWPSEVRPIVQRYRDAPPATLRVLTGPAFAAAKLSAWHDRRAPRDLYDMWAMAGRGMISEEAVGLFGRFGSFTRASAVSFAEVPTKAQWDSALAHQCIPEVGPEQAAAVVGHAWARI